MIQIQTAGEQIASGSSQVSDASQSLSQGATESAASLEEITSSMNEMGSQTRQSAENATQANRFATQARVAVGMPVTQYPPHRSRRADFPHRAPASGRDAQTLLRIRMLDSRPREPSVG
jgi:hypothetical protein